MTDMLEKVQRAIAGICNDKGQELASKCEMQAPAIPWQAFEREAKAAIEALRSPTDAMLDEGDCTLPQFDEGYIRMECLRVAWQAMIDKALEGKDG